MLVGLGTETTAAFAIAALGRHISDGITITAVATSDATASAGSAAGIEIRDLGGISAIDLHIDGIDEFDPDFRATKGAGGAMLREKVVASAATRMIAIGDAAKSAARLGGQTVPVEVLPAARAIVAQRVIALGGEPSLRQDASCPSALTDRGNVILDRHFGLGTDCAPLAAALDALPRLLRHGLFLAAIHALYIGISDGVIRSERLIKVNSA